MRASAEVALANQLRFESEVIWKSLRRGYPRGEPIWARRRAYFSSKMRLFQYRGEDRAQIATKVQPWRRS